MPQAGLGRVEVIVNFLFQGMRRIVRMRQGFTVLDNHGVEGDGVACQWRQRLVAVVLSENRACPRPLLAGVVVLLFR